VRVLLTGATGFVGSHLAEALAEAGHTVRCTMRSTSDPRWLRDLPVERVPLDLLRPEGDSLARAVEGVEVVIHAAGITRARRASDYHQANAGGTARLASASLGRLRRFVLISSLAARGPDGTHAPESAYGRSKLEAERRLAEPGDRLESVVLRPAAVYGPRDTDLLPLFGMARRGLLTVPRGGGVLQPAYATDVARAALLAATAPYPGFGPFPVAEGRRYSWDEVVAGLGGVFGQRVRVVRVPAPAFALAGGAAEAAAKVVGRAPAFDRRRARDLASRSWTCDPSETEEALGWRAEVALPEGLRLTTAWYREAGWI
jgi:nucleoside-diphosphate-sugar epimerase